MNKQLAILTEQDFRDAISKQLTDTPEPERTFDAEDVEEWHRRSEEQGAE